MTLTKEEILQSAQRPQVRRVSTPEWGNDGHVFVRMLTGTEADAVQNLLGPASENNKPRHQAESMAGIVVLCACDDEGRRTFDDADRSAVQTLALAALMRVATAAMDFNGMSKEAMERLEKN